MNQENLKKIEEIIEEFFKKMTFKVEINFLPQKDYNFPATPEDKRIYTLPVDLNAEEPQLLIGGEGETLLDIQHLLKAILKRRIDTKESFYLDLDINDYKKKKIAYLREMARSLAEEVVLTKKEKILPPMPAYERRIIHLELADNPNVTTESIGQEPERKVVIKPYT